MALRSVASVYVDGIWTRSGVLGPVEVKIYKDNSKVEWLLNDGWSMVSRTWWFCWPIPASRIALRYEATNPADRLCGMCACLAAVRSRLPSACLPSQRDDTLEKWWSGNSTEQLSCQTKDLFSCRSLV